MKKGYIYLLIAALSYASMGVLIKSLSFDMGAFSQLFFRLIVSALITFVILVVRKKPVLLKRKSDYILMLFMGVLGYGIHLMLFTLALYHTTIGNTLFIFSSYPILTAFLAHFFLKEKITKRIGIAIILLICVLFLLFDPNHLSNSFLGNTLALFASITFALYVIWSRILSNHGNAPETITLWSVVLAVIVSGLSASYFEHVTLHMSSLNFFFLIIFGFLNASAFNFVNKGFATVKAGVGTMILLLEPLIGAFLGFVFFQEVPSILFIIGAIIMFTAIYIATFKLD